MGERAVKHVRKFLGQRLRALRKQRALSQERLGDRSGLSGKFIGEVERGEKSISIDSLYRVSVALEIPLRELTDVRSDKRCSRRAFSCSGSLPSAVGAVWSRWRSGISPSAAGSLCSRTRSTGGI